MGGKGYASCGLRYHYTLWLRYHYILWTAISLHLVAAISLHLVAAWVWQDAILSYTNVTISTPQHLNISTPQHLNTSTSQFTVMWKQPCLTSYLTRQRFCSRISRSTSESTHFSVSLRTCRRRGPSGSSTV